MLISHLFNPRLKHNLFLFYHLSMTN